MHNLILVAKYEYRRMVVRRGFLFGTLAEPAGLGLLILVTILYAESTINRLPIGYVDRANILKIERWLRSKNRRMRKQASENLRAKRKRGRR